MSEGAFELWQQVSARLQAGVERLATGERWILRTALVATVLALLCSFPRPEATLRVGAAPEWQPLLAQIEHPLTPSSLDPDSHGAKTAFRLVVPLVAHALGLGPMALKVLEVLCGIGLLALIALGAERASGDRSCAVLVTLLVASCFPGISAFVEHRGFFDGVALLGLALACAGRSFLPVFVGILLAAWTDERGAIAGGLVLMLHLADTAPETGARRLLDPRVLALFVAGAVYIGVRLFLSAHFGLHTPIGNAGVGFLVYQLNNAALGLWTALEGGWLLVGAAGVVLWREGRRVFLLGATLAGGAVALVALMVWDITRSMAYLLPALLLALRVLRDHEPDLPRLCRLAFVLALLWPNYYVAGKGEASWNFPLPLMLLKYLQG